MSSVSAQLGGNLNYISSIAEENTNIFNASMAGARAQANATIFGQVGQLAGGAYQGMTGQTVGQGIGKVIKGS
jgi:outer membrane lipoprotein SlyB